MKILVSLGFILTLESFLCDEECGGTFAGYQYPITSPNYPDDYPPDRHCVYVLRGSESAECDQDYRLQFLDFQLEASDGCAKDYVRVGERGYIYCGNSVGIRKFEGRDKSLRLTFHSDKNTTAKGFRILVTTLPCADAERNHSKISDPDKEQRGDQKAPAPAEGKESSPRNPSAKLELPEFERQDFHDANRGYSPSANDDSIGSVTSYLFLPASPSRIGAPRVSGSDNSSNIRNEIVIEHWEDESSLDVQDPPADESFATAYRQIPSSLIISRNSQQTGKTSGPVRVWPLDEFANGWPTYGPPNWQAPAIPNNNDNHDDNANDYDPFANTNPPVNYNPNCGAGGNGNPNNYYPDYNNNENNPGVNNFAGSGGNANPHYPGNGNNFDVNFAVDSSSNDNNNNNNNYYGTDDATYGYDGSVAASECCGTVYSSSNFLLTSPGFPALIYSSSEYECRYTIQRSSPSVCQLQMNLKFFNFGSEDQFCAYGHVEIDGRRFCGCETGANITSSFDNIATKTIRVRYAGYPKNKFSGFVIQVSQVSCATSFFRFRGGFPQLRREPLLIENYREKRDAGYYYERPRTAGSATSRNLRFLNTCRILKFLNWVKAAKLVYLRGARCPRGTSNTGLSSSISVVPIFPDTANSPIINFPPNSNCETVNLLEGTVSSPYYPSGYPSNLNRCYRFYKAPGFCQLELAILDFDLENSTICRKDFVSFGGQKRRYCGSSLAGSRTIIDVTRTSFADLYFKTDSSGTGRGFKAGFSQISC